MGSLIKLAAWVLIESSKAGSVRAATRRIVTAALCAGFASMLMLAAFGCAATALWNLALPALGPVGAPLIVAGTLSAATVALATAAGFLLRRGRRRPSAATQQLLLSQASRIFNEHKGAVLLAAVIAGIAAARGGRKS